MKKFYCLINFIVAINFAYAGSIILHTKNATVWLPQQSVSGNIFNLNANIITVHVNDSTFTIPVKAQGEFVFSVLLKQKNNSIWVEAGNKNNHATSDTIQYTLGYKPLPLAVPQATLKGNTIFLSADVISNPYHLPLSFTWFADKHNPASIKIISPHAKDANFVMPSTHGDYYINLLVIAGKDSAQFQTLITRTDSVHCFNIQTDHATWIDNAIMYEITPFIFTENGNYADITAKLPEISKLGINCIWLQPVYQTPTGDQGYDVTDYFALRTDLGSEQQLQQLIATAKKLNMKVLFDFVPNHTSMLHPYAQDVVTNNTNSHYYNFYQHTNDNALYSSLYEKDSLGFYHYFWKDLINLNYDNTEVQQWIIEACKYWLKKFDLDGYRFDAMWALNARNDSFGTQLKTELKSIKPDILLLAEDKGERKKVYAEGYDAAYDWRTDTNWISHWSWQYDYDPKTSLTIFNYPDEDKRAQKLRSALFTGDTTHLRLRFMENNDLPRFINDHGLAKTKMVAAFMFALPGIPLIYDGQEAGCTNRMYSSKPIFKSDQSIQSLDKFNLFPYYQQLIQIRNNYSSLRSMNMQDMPLTAAGSVIALHRWSNNEDFIVLMNMSKDVQPVNIDVSSVIKNDSLFFTDVLTGETFTLNKKNLKLDMPPNTTKLLLANNEAFATDK